MVIAYLDPGSGSAIVGAVAAGCAGAAVAVKAVLFKFWSGRKNKGAVCGDAADSCSSDDAADSCSSDETGT